MMDAVEERVRSNSNPVMRCGFAVRVAIWVTTIVATFALADFRFSRGNHLLQDGRIECTVVTVEALLLESKANAAEGMLVIGPVQNPRLSFFDPISGGSLAVGCFENAPNITVAANTRRLSLTTLGTEGNPMVGFNDGADRFGIQFLILDRGLPYLTIQGLGRKEGIRFAKRNEASVYFTVEDMNGNASIILFHAPDGTSISLFDKHGHVRAAVGQSPGIVPAVNLFDTARIPVMQATVDSAGTSKIRLINTETRTTRTLK